MSASSASVNVRTVSRPRSPTSIRPSYSNCRSASRSVPREIPMAADSSVSTSRLPGSISRAVTALRNISKARSRRLVRSSSTRPVINFSSRAIIRFAPLELTSTLPVDC